MKTSFLLSIVALAVAVVADPVAIVEAEELHVTAAPMIGNQIVPQSKRSVAEVVEEQIAAAALIFNTVQPLDFDVADEEVVTYTADNEATGLEARDLEKRGVCQKGYGPCPGQNKCCPLNGRCCTRGCCKKGYWCYSTGCCKLSEFGCEGNTCCPRSSQCCRGGGCCSKGYQCWISAKGKKGCCPIGKRCA